MVNQFTHRLISIILKEGIRARLLASLFTLKLLTENRESTDTMAVYTRSPNQAGGEAEFLHPRKMAWLPVADPWQGARIVPICLSENVADWAK